jgi:hypothetical protein
LNENRKQIPNKKKRGKRKEHGNQTAREETMKRDEMKNGKT